MTDSNDLRRRAGLVREDDEHTKRLFLRAANRGDPPPKSFTPFGARLVALLKNDPEFRASITQLNPAWGSPPDGMITKARRAMGMEPANLALDEAVVASEDWHQTIHTIYNDLLTARSGIASLSLAPSVNTKCMAYLNEMIKYFDSLSRGWAR